MNEAVREAEQSGVAGQLSSRVRALPASKVREIFDRANKLESLGQRIIHLEIGRPWFDTAPAIKEAAKAALDRGEVHYSPNRGIFELRVAISRKLAEENGISADPDSEILVTCGNKQATFLALNALVDEGDEVIMTDPHYGPHFKEALFVGAIPRMLPLSPNDGWKLHGEALRDLVGPRTKAIVFNSPHNPSGRVFSREEMQEVVQCAVENNLVVVTDETYEYFTYDGQTHYSLASFDGMRDRTISTFAFTKSYAMDGWRLGYAAGPATAIAAMTKIVQLDTAGPNTFAQHGAIEAVKSGASGAREMVAEDREARDRTLASLREMGMECSHVQGTIYAFPAIEDLGLTDEEFAVRLLDEHGVAVTPGSAFGEQGRSHVRIAFGAVPLETLDEALGRIQTFVSAVREAGGRGRAQISI